MPNHISIYVDGACKGNPGPGGWGVLMRISYGYACHVREISGYEANTTNNRMELTAALKALQAIDDETGYVTVYTDSKYVVNGITKWIRKWIKNDWKIKGKDVLNKDLWQELHYYAVLRSVSWNWVKGHNGNIGNERADFLAKDAISKYISNRS